MFYHAGVGERRSYGEVRRGWPGSWSRAAGDNDALHYFADIQKPDLVALRQVREGPAVGKSESDAGLSLCHGCLLS